MLYTYELCLDHTHLQFSRHPGHILHPPPPPPPALRPWRLVMILNPSSPTSAAVAVLPHPAGLALCGSCPGYHSCSGSAGQRPCAVQKKALLALLHIFWLLTAFHPTFRVLRPVSGGRYGSHLGLSAQQAPNLSLLTICESLLCCPLTSEASLARVENGTNLWV